MMDVPFLMSHTFRRKQDKMENIQTTLIFVAVHKLTEGRTQ